MMRHELEMMNERADELASKAMPKAIIFLLIAIVACVFAWKMQTLVNACVAIIACFIAIVSICSWVNYKFFY